ncbi:hypothetical protein ACLKA7_014088 [Drosophila subpalustris]
MSTLATSRQPTLNLILKRTSRQEEQEEQETETEAHRAVVAMHPDCLPMPLPLAASGSHSGNSPQLQQQPEDDGDEDAEGSACDEQHLVNVLDEPNDDDDMEDDDLEEEELELDDAASCCSENSVLSVGQEQSQVAAAAHATRQRLLMSQLYRPSAFSSVSHSMQQQHASALSLHQHHVQVNEDAAIIMAHTPASFQEEFLRKSQLYAEELMKQQMQLMAAARVNALTAAVMPLGGLRGPKMMTTQQLQMAAAAAAAAAMRPTTTTTTTATAATATTTGQDALAQLTATALGIGSAAGNQHQLLMQQQQQQQQQNLSHAFQQQSQHNNNNNNNNNYNNNNFNNNINNLRAEERALKFSIDNILKADFGNRLQQRLAASGAAAAAAAAVGVAPPKAPRKTVKPLNLAQTQPSLSFSSSLANICSNSNDSNSTATSSSTANNNNPPTSAIDLVKSPNANANATSPAPGSKSGEDAATGTATGTGTGTGSSSTPIVWPAWVYCTRYSDRPSSEHSRFPILHLRLSTPGVNLQLISLQPPPKRATQP